VPRHTLRPVLPIPSKVIRATPSTIPFGLVETTAHTALRSTVCLPACLTTETQTHRALTVHFRHPAATTLQLPATGIPGYPETARQLTQRLEAIADRKTADGWVDQYIKEKDAFLAKRDADAITTQPIQPSGLFLEMRKVFPRDAIVTMDAGTLCLQATDALCYGGPRSLFTPLDFGLVGFSFACGLGAKVAAPERPVISLMGDGGFGMTLSELSTAVDCGINTVTIVMNNGCWGAEKAYQRDFFNGRYIGADISSPPFDKLAELYGAKGYRVDQLGDVGAAVEAALECGKPAVIDVAVDPAALYSFRRDSFKHRGG